MHKCTLAHVNLAEIYSVRSLEAVEAESGAKIYLPHMPFGLLTLLIGAKGQVDFQSLFYWETLHAHVSHVLLASMRSLEAVECE